MNVINIIKIDYENITFTNCANNEDNTDIILPTILITLACGLSVLCLMS